VNPQDLSQNPGEEFGRKALADALAKADAYCTHETQRISLENQSRMAAVRAELALLHDEECAFQQRLHIALPPGDAKDRRRKAVYYWLVTFALTIAGFFFSLLAFEPYRLGWKSYLYCAGIALVSPFCVEKFLEAWASPRLFKVLATVACVAALSALVLLSLVRGDVLAHQVKNVAPVVLFTGESPTPPPTETTFYDQTLTELRLLMALLALSMEIAAGVALYEARRHSASAGEDASHIAQELSAIRGRMVAKLQELRTLENQAAIFANQFWREFYRALADGLSSRAIVKVSSFILAVLLIMSSYAKADEPLNLVIALDLTKSVAVGSPGQSQEFEKNVQATGHILTCAPANAHVTVMGITDQSFGQLLLLLDARILQDPGYFGERLNAARRSLVEAWSARAKSLSPRFTHTDIFGALHVASQIFQEAPKGRNVLIILSDMRENAGDYKLERSGHVHLALARDAKARTIPDLKGVEVYVLGADNAGKSTSYWMTLRGFWTEYFQKAGAALRWYSILREVPDLAR
jgi:hypothetical protein